MSVNISCSGSDFDGAKGCAVLVYAGAGPTGAAALNVPEGDITSYEMLHGNWIKSADCKFAEVPGFGERWRRAVNLDAERPKSKFSISIRGICFVPH